jgi:hypothetical protein
MAVKVSVTTTSKNRIAINTKKPVEVRTVSVIPEQPATKLENMTDVEIINPSNNDTLVYDSSSEKFVSKELPVVNGGSF